MFAKKGGKRKRKEDYTKSKFPFLLRVTASLWGTLHTRGNVFTVLNYRMLFPQLATWWQCCTFLFGPQPNILAHRESVTLWYLSPIFWLIALWVERMDIVEVWPILQYFPVMLMTMTTTTAAETTTTTVGWRADLIKWKTLEEILFKRISHQFVCHSVSMDTLNQISQQLVAMLDSSNHLLQNTFPLPCGWRYCSETFLARPQCALHQLSHCSKHDLTF